MSTAYAYTVRTEEDTGSTFAAITAHCRRYLERKPWLAWEGILTDSYEDLGVHVWQRPNGKILHDRLRVGNGVLFWGVDRCFLSPADLFETCDDLVAQGMHPFLVDIGVDPSSQAGLAALAIAKRIAEMPVRTTKGRK